jgi:hypothetical protein
VIIALCPLPALAGGPDQAAKKVPGIRASAAAIAKSEPLAATQGASTQSHPAGVDSPSFFKSPAGIAVLVTLAAGVGYALYSTQNDRITSPAKQ